MRWTLVISYQTKPTINLSKNELFPDKTTYQCDVDDDIVLFEIADEEEAMARASAIAHAIHGTGEIPFYLGGVYLTETKYD